MGKIQKWILINKGLIHKLSKSELKKLRKAEAREREHLGKETLQDDVCVVFNRVFAVYIFAGAFYGHNDPRVGMILSTTFKVGRQGLVSKYGVEPVDEYMRTQYTNPS